jgi:hypothetical protein
MALYGVINTMTKNFTLATPNLVSPLLFEHNGQTAGLGLFLLQVMLLGTRAVGSNEQEAFLPLLLFFVAFFFSRFPSNPCFAYSSLSLFSLLLYTARDRVRSYASLTWRGSGYPSHHRACRRRFPLPGLSCKENPHASQWTDNCTLGLIEQSLDQWVAN